jgi:hypothetical protein
MGVLAALHPAEEPRQRLDPQDVPLGLIAQHAASRLWATASDGVQQTTCLRLRRLQGLAQIPLWIAWQSLCRWVHCFVDTAPARV